MIAKNLFKAYDIRGIVDEDLSESAMHQIGHAIGSEAMSRGVSRIIIGCDGRLSGERLLKILAQGITLAGINVIDIGTVPTPVLYFATRHFDIGSGVVVTGSHNPPQYNGLKMLLNGETLYGDMISSLYERIVKGDLYTATQAGSISQEDILPAYLDAVAADIKLTRPMKIIIDCGNGVGGVIAGSLFKRLGCNVIELFCDVDGHFPNHHPDPADPHNLIDLQNALRDSDAEIGLAFDGDADRLGVVTKEGEIIYSDRLIMLFARDILAQQQGKAVIFDTKCSAHLAPWIIQHGGIPLMWKTGHSLMKAKLRELGETAAFAGEMSGHMYFNDRWFGFDDGLYAGARLLEILSQRIASHNAQEINQVLSGLSKSVSTPEINIMVKEGDGSRIVNQFRAHIDIGDAVLHTVDGVRIDYIDGFGLVRPSNTTPMLVLRFEANDETALARIQAHFRTSLLAVAPDLVLNF